MKFPILTESFRIKRLEPPEDKLHMVLDTDTYNEVDDQFAVVYALFSPRKSLLMQFMPRRFITPGPMDPLMVWKKATRKYYGS